ncbi:prion-like-(Q/N-rich) domain-bearing protein 25 [Glossina fuscipes]|uniref:Prion-like-(Q/N-rich) domain-bearing protein 25 n=1 Tax=Glossina fuscipes TaxID=7396 RepID=A0A9C5ZBE9_9MUSC|nr:prion-like-(Q/N-rich) domain-bearing protein 25 [Glossina fuscipes]
MLERSAYCLVVLTFTIRIHSETHALYWPCELNDNCTAENSVCISATGQCECKEFDYVFSGDYTKCLKSALFGDKCREDIQCNLMPSAAYCKSGVCSCVDKETYIKGSCKQVSNLEQYCDESQICDFGYDRDSVQCKCNDANCTCACADGYYRRHGNICRRKSTEINDACVVNEDCRNLGDNVKCMSLTCQHVDEIKAINSLPVKDIATSLISESEKNSFISSELSSSECVQPQGPLFSNQSWSNEFSPKTESNIAEDNRINFDFELQEHLIPLGTKIVEFDKSTDAQDKSHVVGSSCTENGKPCPNLSYSFCSANKCLCKHGYYHKNGKCFAELGEAVLSSDDCESEFDPTAKKCICPKNHFYEKSLRECRKPIQIHLSCSSDSQCSPFGDAYCHLEIPRRCTCEEYAEYNALLQMCIYKGTVNVKCNTDDDCPTKHSFCSNNLCKCRQYYIENGHECSAGVGAVCAKNDDCFTQNSECTSSHSSDYEQKNKICQCRKGFVHFRDECLSEAEDIEAECVDSEQCKLLGASCNNGRCSCTYQQHFTNGYCETKKGIGQHCSRATECYIEKNAKNLECRNSICQCSYGFQSDGAKKDCIRVVPSKKNSSGKPSALKVVTFLLIGSAFLVTSAAIKQAYY